jgi:hypothetical protein
MFKYKNYNCFTIFQIQISASNSPEEIVLSDDETETSNNKAEEIKNLKSEVEKENDDGDVVTLISDDEPELQIVEEPEVESQLLKKRVSQDIDSFEPSCVSYQKPKEIEYELKQYGSLTFWNIRLDVCVLSSKPGIVEVLFFNNGLNSGPKPAPWDGLPLGGSVKAVDHDLSSGVEYQRSYHFNNIAGSPKILVNASQRDIKDVSENLVRKNF